MLLNGSGLALTPTRVPVLTTWEASADPPPSAAAAIVAVGLACACWAMTTPTAPPTTGRTAVCATSQTESSIGILPTTNWPKYSTAAAASTDGRSSTAGMAAMCPNLPTRPSTSTTA